MKLRCLIFLIISLFSSQASAVGDRWTTGSYTFEYIADIDNVAVLSWSLRTAKDGEIIGYVFFPGLTDGRFGGLAGDGYYMLKEGGHCDKAAEGPNGQKSHNWGRAVIVFHDPPPPTAWTLVMGECSGPPMGANSMRATPIK